MPDHDHSDISQRATSGITGITKGSMTTPRPGPRTAQSALERLHQAASADNAPTPLGGMLIGTVGQDVPVELVHAAGATPRRLRGNPEWDMASADHYLGRGLDPAIRSLMAGILSGAFGHLDAILISSDCDASQRLFYVLREMRRVEPHAEIPPVHLIDILHLPRESTARYNLVRVQQLLDVLERWTGIRPDARELNQQARNADRRRALQREVMRLRAHTPALITGVDALAVFAAADRMPASEYESCLTQLVALADELTPRAGRRVFLTGSNHDHPLVYNDIEAAGAVIVGEDHDHGQLLCERDIDDDTSRRRDDDLTGVLDAIARRYQHNGPTAQRASINERAAYAASAADRAAADLLISYVRVMDEAPLWDFASQRAAAAVPAGAIVRQQYGAIDTDALARALTEPEKTGVNA